MEKSIDAVMLNNELMERIKNFHINPDRFHKVANEYKDLFSTLHDINDSTLFLLDNMNYQDKKHNIVKAFEMIYENVIDTFAHPFDRDNKNIFDVCLYASLCTFLHDTRRIDGLSLREFIYNNSPMEYNKKGSPNFFKYNEQKKDSAYYNSIVSDETSLRKYRNRLLSPRNVYNKNTEWSAIRKSSEHEWALYYIINSDDESRKTYKRFGNLYNDINKVMDSLNSDSDISPNIINTAYSKFLSKVKKIDYESFLKLNKFILSHICKEQEYYGMNVYRLERCLRLHRITNIVKNLHGCINDCDKNRLILNSIILKDIHYPKLYQHFSSFSDTNSIILQELSFLQFMNIIAIISHLIIDNLIEKNTLEIIGNL